MPSATKAKHSTQELAEILSQLHLALKNIQLYPPGHDLLQERLAAVHQSLARLLVNKKQLLFGVARDTFTHAELPVGEDSPACTAFAKILTQHEIASITFFKGISQHSLFLFLKTVGNLPEQRSTGENILQELSNLNIPHLRVQLIDYSYFDHNVHGDSSTAPLTWMTFTQKLTSGVLNHSGEFNNSGSQLTTMDPETLAAAINKQAGKHPEVIQQYSTLLDQLLQQAPQKSATTLGGRELSMILSSLTPDLRQQFLDTTITHCDKNIQSGNTESILKHFSNSMVLDMLKQVNKEKSTVSPALLNLIQKLSTMDFNPAGQTSSSIARQRKAGNLLRQDEHDQQMSPAYQQSLQKLSEYSLPSTPAPADFPLNVHLKSMEDTQLNHKIVQAILLFMDKTSETKEYRTLADKLMEISLLLPDDGAFNLLQIIARQLKQQAANKVSTNIGTIAAKCVKDLAAPDFLDYILSILVDATDQEKQGAIDYLVLLGPETTDTLLKIYCLKPRVLEQDPLVIVLKTFRVKALTRIFPLLQSSNTVNISKLLLLIGYIGTDGTVRLLQPWLKHENTKIRDQILHLLLPLQEQNATELVISMLESKDEPTVNTAIQFCDTHRTRACVPALLELLQYSFVTRAAIERNRQLIPVLSHIADPKALPALEKIAFCKWLFLRQEVTDMKRLIFYSLKNYLPEDRKALLRKGQKTKDKKIVTICSTLLHSQQRMMAGK